MHPLDLLQLSRTSKTVRAAVLAYRNRPAWQAALASVEGLPLCPEQLQEPDYAALVFEKICSLCGASRANRVEYTIGLRFCRSCYQEQ
ncbi:hypothetical protein GY45DRAFT_1257028 [Cubamyces sp. BRFM 1775]|nr:hypothetical protein GY45DRAFT_1257028 [Cubamyces sp. BRFM 1775]